jgi:hypothetical protein
MCLDGIISSLAFPLPDPRWGADSLNAHPGLVQLVTSKNERVPAVHIKVWTGCVYYFCSSRCMLFSWIGFICTPRALFLSVSSRSLLFSSCLCLSRSLALSLSFLARSLSRSVSCALSVIACALSLSYVYCSRCDDCETSASLYTHDVTEL